MTSLLIGLSWAGIQYSWNSVATVVPICVGLISIGASLAWETYGASEPFLRRSLFYCPSAFAAYAGALCQGFLVGFPIFISITLPTSMLTTCRRHVALLFPLLRSLLLYIRPLCFPNTIRARHLPRHSLPPPRKYHCFRTRLPPRPLPLGRLARLGHHDTQLRSPSTPRRGHSNPHLGHHLRPLRHR